MINPVSDEDVISLGFSLADHAWLSQPSKEIQNLNTNPSHLISSLATNACSGNLISLRKLEPEDLDFSSPSWFVVFESSPTLAIELNTAHLDWSIIESQLESSIPVLFKSFSETWPGLRIGGFDRPAFMLSSEEWFQHQVLSSYDGDCRPLIDPKLFSIFKENAPSSR